MSSILLTFSEDDMLPVLPNPNQSSQDLVFLLFQKALIRLQPYLSVPMWLVAASFSTINFTQDCMFKHTHKFSQQICMCDI